REDEVRGLAPDAVEREEPLERARHRSVVLLDDRARDGVEDLRLRLVEADRIDELRELALGDREERLRRARAREELLHRDGRRRVLGAQREETGDEHLEGIAAHLGRERDDGDLERAREGTDLRQSTRDREERRLRR